MNGLNKKKCGVLLPVFSLPSRYGIGGFGKEAYRFVDFLAQTGHDYWQVLPLSPTSYGDSPYQSPSAFAGNPYFIDLDLLCEEGLLTNGECRAEQTEEGIVNYARLYARRTAVLRKAFSRFSRSQDYEAFVAEHAEWLLPYARFMALKEQNGGAVWSEWKTEREDREAEAFWLFVQFQFFRQWGRLKRYANARGIEIIGDMPIYVAYDSADVWRHRENFLLDSHGVPVEVAGVPPDAFSESGQLWGNPLYDWKSMKQNGYAWWHARIRHALALYDWVRIDHFIGFVRYYCIPSSETDAKKGVWRKGPGAELFKGLEEEHIIAEDLGLVTNEVRAAIAQTGYAGMKILQHAFGGDADCEHKPSNFSENNVVYTGTHDNETLFQRVSCAKGNARKTLKADLKEQCARVGLRARTLTNGQICASIRRLLYACKANTVILPMADALNLGREGRINSPSTVGSNWQWRLPSNYARCKKGLLRLSALRKKN